MAIRQRENRPALASAADKSEDQERSIMNKFGIQYLESAPASMPEGGVRTNGSSGQYREIIAVLKKFQEGYTERDLKKADSFVEELFVNGGDVSILGTATGELAFGIEEVKDLIKGDWEYWGAVTLDYENAYVSCEGDAAWISVKGSVAYSFEDTPERYERYVDFIKDKVRDAELTPRQKISFINWVLALNYHQRAAGKREYLWPMCLSGVLLGREGKWKITHLHFSIPKANFPDERFESSGKYFDNFNVQKKKLEEYKNNKITSDIKALLKNFEEEFGRGEDIPEESVRKYFNADGMPYVVGPEHQRYDSVIQIREFFSENDKFEFSLDVEQAIASGSGKITWVTAAGTLKHHFTEDQLAGRALEEAESVLKSDLTPEEKLFAVHRSVAYSLKEGAAGPEHTCPIRMTAVILNRAEGPVFNSIHFSFPFYWVFEGKMDSVEIHNRANGGIRT